MYGSKGCLKRERVLLVCDLYPKECCREPCIMLPCPQPPCTAQRLIHGTPLMLTHLPGWTLLGGWGMVDSHSNAVTLEQQITCCPLGEDWCWGTSTGLYTWLAVVQDHRLWGDPNPSLESDHANIVKFSGSGCASSECFLHVFLAFASSQVTTYIHPAPQVLLGTCKRSSQL